MREVGVFASIGDARQVQGLDGYAYVAARGDGLWILDLTQPDPVSGAKQVTGMPWAARVQVLGSVAFVTNSEY